MQAKLDKLSSLSKEATEESDVVNSHDKFHWEVDQPPAFFQAGASHAQIARLPRPPSVSSKTASHSRYTTGARTPPHNDASTPTKLSVSHPTADMAVPEGAIPTTQTVQELILNAIDANNEKVFSIIDRSRDLDVIKDMNATKVSLAVFPPSHAVAAQAFTSGSSPYVPRFPPLLPAGRRSGPVGQQQQLIADDFEGLDTLQASSVGEVVPQGFVDYHYRTRTQLIAEISELKKRLCDEVLFRYEKQKWQQVVQEWEEQKQQMELILRRNTELEMKLDELHIDLKHEEKEKKMAQEALKRERDLRSVALHEKEDAQAEIVHLKLNTQQLQDTMLKQENSLMQRALKNIADVAQERREQEVQERENWDRDKLALISEVEYGHMQLQLLEKRYSLDMKFLKEDHKMELESLNKTTKQLQAEVTLQNKANKELHYERLLLMRICQDEVQTRARNAADELQAYEQELDWSLLPPTELQLFQAEEWLARSDIIKDYAVILHDVMLRFLLQYNQLAPWPSTVDLINSVQATLTESNAIGYQLQTVKAQVKAERGRAEAEAHELQMAQQQEKTGNKGKGRKQVSQQQDVIPIRKGVRFPPQISEAEFKRAWKAFRQLDQANIGQLTQRDIQAHPLHGPGGRVIDVAAFRRIVGRTHRSSVNFFEVLQEWYPNLSVKLLESLFDEHELERMRTRSSSNVPKAQHSPLAASRMRPHIGR